MQPGEPAKEPIKLFLDDQPEPFKVAEPPIRFRFSTIHLPDGPHTLRIEASNGLAPPTIKSIPFSVRNGVALSLSGLEPDQTIGGQVELIINAYAGNTEVDFEPKQAETPQPIPTWAWVLLLAVMSWSLYYLVTPHRPEAGDTFDVVRPTPALGQRIYTDTCARCHGEDGRGRETPDGKMTVAALRNTKELAVARNPFKLLSRVVTGVPGTQMPAWGPLLSNEEIVASVNHVRSWWGHDASTIDLQYRYPPKEIEVLECNLAEAMKAKDVEQIAAWGWPTIKKPVLFRIGDDLGGYMGEEVQARWDEYFKALCDGKIQDFKLREVRYDYEPETADQEGSVVIAMGRVYQESLTHGGKTVFEKGRFIRVYQRKNGLWNLALDFADIPFEVGCDPDELAADDAGATDDGAGGEDAPPPAAGDVLGFAEVMAYFKNMGKDARSAPHANFWEFDYQKFVNMSFDYETENGDVTVRMVTPYSSKTSNLIIALKTGKALIACMSGNKTTIDIRRMPVGADYMADADVKKIEDWIDAGCPEVAGEPSVLPNVPPDDLLCPGGGGEQVSSAGGRKMLGGCAALLPPPTQGAGAAGGAPAAGNTGGFPPPKDDSGFPPANDDGGFPPPKDDGGFPPPKDDGGFPPPQDDGGFPPPADPKKDAGGFPPPADPKKDAGGFPPAEAPKQDTGGFPPPEQPKKDDGSGTGGFPPPHQPPKDDGNRVPPDVPPKKEPKKAPPQFPPPEDPPAGRGKAPSK